MRRIALFALALCTAGCATVINDQKERIAVRSEPAGAVVSVDCGSHPVYGGITPANLIIDRTAEPCALTIAKEGYVEQRVVLERQVSGAVRGNKVPGVIAGSILGVVAWFNGNSPEDAYAIGSALGEAPGDAIDHATGAAYKHAPSTVTVRLDPTP